jgi:hypothetical protein
MPDKEEALMDDLLDEVLSSADFMAALLETARWAMHEGQEHPEPHKTCRYGICPPNRRATTRFHRAIRSYEKTKRNV